MRARTKWANLPLEREHTLDASGPIALVELAEDAAYLAVRAGDAVRRLLWLPQVPTPREKGSLVTSSRTVPAP